LKCFEEGPVGFLVFYPADEFAVDLGYFYTTFGSEGVPKVKDKNHSDNGYEKFDEPGFGVFSHQTE
jgi:hypothetical protein